MKISGDEVSSSGNDLSSCGIKDEPVFLNECKEKRYNEFGEIVKEETICYSGNQGNKRHFSNRGFRGNQRGFNSNKPAMPGSLGNVLM